MGCARSHDACPGSRRKAPPKAYAIPLRAQGDTAPLLPTVRRKELKSSTSVSSVTAACGASCAADPLTYKVFAPGANQATLPGVGGAG